MNEQSSLLSITHHELGQPSGSTGEHWTPLGYFAAYRTLLAILLVGAHWLGLTPQPFGSLFPNLYESVIHIHLLIVIFSAIATHGRLLPFNTLADLQTFTDIVAITLLMHASGGLGSGFGMLLVVSVASAGIFNVGRTIAILFAALATLAVLVEQSFLFFNAPQAGKEAFNYSQAGMLGATLFATAALAHILAQRVRISEHLARQRGLDLANMAQLTEYVIQHMQTGVLVADANDMIRLVNVTARRQLGLDSQPVIGKTLQRELPALHRHLHNWREGLRQESPLLEVNDTNQPLLPSFMAIGQSGGNLIFLEDAREATHQAQQLKLASLGRLTASIAHEVRNPLGAISHAGELLDESPLLDKADKRLLRIILEQSKRINALIESILNLGAGNRSRPESLDLASWLHQFLQEFEAHAGCHPGDVFLNIGRTKIIVQFDPLQLYQIVWNLCLNGLRHTNPKALPKLEISIGRSKKETWLDVRDYGPGIDAETAEHLFEPFFTTAGQGTGLGLYLSRELAESNYASLIYLPPADGGARFRLLFRR